MKKILIACEYSGIVRESFNKLGYNALSCDIIDTDIPGNHYIGNVEDIINENWDLIIAHPPCTYLCNSGVRWLKNDSKRYINMLDAVNFFNMFLTNKCKHICVENPIMHCYARDRIFKNYDQIVQPYFFGDNEQKSTCLWLKNLPLLKPDAYIYGTHNTSIHHCRPSVERSKIRSKTFPGIARAIAEQFSAKVLKT